MPVHGRMTVDEFFALPDDGKRYELLDGVVEEMTAPNTKHQRVIGRLYVILVAILQDMALGEVLLAPYDVVLDDFTVLQPDLVYVSRGNASVITEANARGAPDLVIEVLSPSTRRKDVVRKSRLYARAGVPFYWIVDPEVDRIEFMARDGDVFTLAARADAPTVAEPPGFPTVRIDLAALFT